MKFEEKVWHRHHANTVKRMAEEKAKHPDGLSVYVLNGKMYDPLAIDGKWYVLINEFIAYPMDYKGFFNCQDNKKDK
jgi:hypothetical protein